MSLEPLSYYQIIFLIPFLAFIVFTLIWMLVRTVGVAIKYKKSTILFGKEGEKVRLSEDQAKTVFLIIQSFKVKEDLNRIDDIIFRKQKKLAKETLSSLREFLLMEFTRCYSDQGCSDPDAPPPREVPNILADRSYLMFTLLTDRVYNILMGSVMEDVEENGLARKKDPSLYAENRAFVFYTSLQAQFSSLYYGIDTVGKEEFLSLMEEKEKIIRDRIRTMYMAFITFSVNGYRKKERLTQSLFQEIAETYNMTIEQVESVLATIESSDEIEV